MADIPLCPPWWPEFIWRLIRRGPRRSPLPDPWVVDVTEELLVALQGYHAASTMSEKLRPEIQHEAVERMQQAVTQLAEGRG